MSWIGRKWCIGCRGWRDSDHTHIENKVRGNSLQCAYCPAPVEASRYSMCKACWWAIDPRNEMIEKLRNPMKNAVLADPDPHREANREARLVKADNNIPTDWWDNTINEYMEAHGLGLDETLLICGTNEMRPISFRNYCFTLLSRVTC